LYLPVLSTPSFAVQSAPHMHLFEEGRSSPLLSQQ
jgi:hypothetical protein